MPPARSTGLQIEGDVVGRVNETAKLMCVRSIAVKSGEFGLKFKKV